MKMKIEVEKLSKYKYVHGNGIFILRLRFGCKIGLGHSSVMQNIHFYINTTWNVLKFNSATLFFCWNHFNITWTIPQQAKNYNRHSKENFPLLVKCFPKIGTGHLSSDLLDSIVVLFYCFLRGRLLSSNSSLFFLRPTLAYCRIVRSNGNKRFLTISTRSEINLLRIQPGTRRLGEGESQFIFPV